MAKVNYEKFTSPTGEASYPHLTTPDTKFDPDGVYKTNLVVSAEDATDFIAELEGARDAFYNQLETAEQAGTSMAPVYADQLDDDGVPTGNVIFKFKMKARVTPRHGDAWEQSPVVLDLDGQAIEDSVWSGSIMKVKGEVIPYRMASTKQIGVSLRLKAVRVEELVTGGANYAEGWE